MSGASTRPSHPTSPIAATGPSRRAVIKTAAAVGAGLLILGASDVAMGVTPEDILKGQLIISDERFPTSWTSPSAFAAKVKAVIDWVNDPEVKNSRGSVRFATRAHYDFLRVFPFQSDSGKVARLLLNILLLRAGLPPAIIHMSDRQRYYEALKGSPGSMVTIVQDAIDNNLSSIEKLIEHYEARRAT